MKQSPTMIRQWEGLFEQRGQSQSLGPVRATLPNSHADAIIQRAAAADEIARIGNLHWKRVSSTRIPRSKRLVAEIEGLVTLKLISHCACKWVGGRPEDR